MYTVLQTIYINVLRQISGKLPMIIYRTLAVYHTLNLIGQSTSDNTMRLWDVSARLGLMLADQEETYI